MELADKIKCVSPVDGSVYAERAVAKKKDIAAAFSAAHAAQEKWKRVPFAERANIARPSSMRCSP